MPSERAAAGGPAASANPRLGIVLCVLAMALFASGDAISKILLRDHSILQIMFCRSLIFLAFAVAYTFWRTGWRGTMTARRPGLQALRGLLLVADSALFALALKLMGLAELNAVYAAVPLMATALAVPVLGEPVGWRRWSAVGVGFLGALLIIKPGLGVATIGSTVALVGALTWALYGLLTRLASRTDRVETSLFFVAATSAIVLTPLGLVNWQSPSEAGLGWLLALSLTSITGQMLLIQAYNLAQASLLQPFSYAMLAVATLLGVVVFGERPDALAVAGTLIVVASGLYVAWRERASGRQAPPADPS